MNKGRRFAWMRSGILVALMTSTASAIAQEASDHSERPSSETSIESVQQSVRELRDQVRELQSAVVEMRSDFERARAESAELRRELDQVRSRSENAVLKSAMATSGSPQKIATEYANPQDQSGEAKKSGRAESLQEEYELLSGKVDDQYQTKVESASKYKVRLSGIVLLNLFSDQGAVDSIDVPTIAYPRPAGDSGGSFGATLRQSEIGFETFGPAVAGAKTSADLQLDLAGGFPQVPNGVNSGLVRLRTGTMRMDWTNTSVVVGQDGIFFSPNSPTSFASLAIPALSGAGNLWNWVPQIRVEHRVLLSENSSLLFQGGILDPVSGEVPPAGLYRQAGPGEASRQPAYGGRIAWTRNVFGQPLRVGGGGFFSPQNYGFGRTVDGWSGMTDVDLPLSHNLFLSGKLYRGSALGGLYSADGSSVVYSGDPAYSGVKVRGLNTIGGWAQLKYRPVNKWEVNAAFGMDNPYAADLRLFPYAAYWNPAIARNQGRFVNMIYRPRSDLLFSAEYRHLATATSTHGFATAGQLNLVMGVLF